jgi:hypothetical protein
VTDFWLLIACGIVDQHGRLEKYAASIVRVQEDAEETRERNWVVARNMAN